MESFWPGLESKWAVSIDLEKLYGAGDCYYPQNVPVYWDMG